MMALTNFLVVGLQDGPVNIINERFTTSMISLANALLIKVSRTSLGKPYVWNLTSGPSRVL